MADQVPLYDGFSAAYDVMVDWAARLEREWPFFEALFGRAQARRVLDVGCGTGRHAVRFAQSGREVVGVDPSAEMLRRAAEHAKGVAGVSFVPAGFGELRRAVGGYFDVVTCLGNTLPHVLGRAELYRALADFAAVLRPGGLLTVQQLNYDRLCAERQRFLGVSTGQTAAEEMLFFRFYDFLDPLLRFNVVTFRRPKGGAWSFHAEATMLRPTLQGELAELLALADFGPVEYYGGYDKAPFDSTRSNDLILVAATRT